ncbi:MAG TPA: hypothetical protein PKA00_06135 [Saprospiraceae bacterium]|nr:hypothetical protein [Saprospiraceae bacterium]HMQ82463.1 hypothetical protein [Saprospiraceae bacterium]
MPSTIAFRVLSWNLKDFGNYDYSATMSRIASTIINSGADIAVILEVTANRKVKGAKIDQDLITSGAKTAIADLLNQLKKKDKASGWMQATSGINAGNADRDGYAFFWKTKTAGKALGTNLLPTKISLVSGPDILRKDGSGKDLGFKGSRRPGACVFKLENPAATPNSQNVLVCGFHAYADFKDDKGIQRSIKDCLLASNAEAAALPVVVGGDLNMDYTANKVFYATLKADTNLGYDTAITSGTGSSLLANPDFSVPNPVVAGNAFDNFLYKKLSLVSAWQTKVIDVILDMTASLPQKKGNKKRTLADLEKEAYTIYYTVNTGIGKTSCISDHFPIIGAFGF